MKATKQTKPQARKRSAERQPSVVPTKARTRRPGARDAVPPSQAEKAEVRASKSGVTHSNGASTTSKTEARTTKDGTTPAKDGASTKDGATSTKATAAPSKGTRSTKTARSVVTNASPRARRTTTGTEPALRRNRRDKTEAPPSENEAQLSSVAETPAVPPTLSTIAEPVETAIGDAAEAPPSVDTSASPPSSLPTLIAPAAQPTLGRRLLKGAFQLPLSLLRSAGASVDKVRDAYKASFLHSAGKKQGLLGQISQRLVKRTS